MHWLLLLRVLYVSAVVAGLVIVAWPRGPVFALVPAAGWTISGSWLDDAPPPKGGYFSGLATGKESRFFRFSEARTGAPNGSIYTDAFVAPRFLIVPVVGFPTAPGNGVFLECPSNRAVRSLLTGDPHEEWSQPVFAIDQGWCDGPVRVHAVSQSPGHYVGVGTPFAATVWHWLVQDSGPVILVLHLLVFVLFAGPMLLAARLLGRRLPRGAACLAWATLPILLFSYGAFFLVAALHGKGKLLAGVCALFSCVGWIAWWRHRNEPSPVWRNDISNYLGQWFFASLFAVALLFLTDPGAGRWNAAYRFAPASWSTDHLIPAIVAEKLGDGAGVDQVLGGRWRVSDRPPLMTGMLLLARPWVDVLTGPSGDFGLLRQEGLKIASILAQTLAVVAGIALMRELLGRDLRRREALAWVAVIISPFFLFNLTYTWPKMLAAACVALGVIVLLEVKRGRGLGALVVSGCIGGALISMGVLSHAGVALGLLSAPVLAWGPRWRRALAAFGVAAFACVLVYLPWAIWVSTVDPPGDTLLKYALTGDLGFSEPKMRFGDFLAMKYSQLTLGDWMRAKWAGLLTLAGQLLPMGRPWNGTLSNPFLGELRLRDFFFVAESSRFLGLAALAGMLAALAGAVQDRTLRRVLLSTGCAGGLGVLLTWAVTLNPQVNHHESYFSILLLYVAAVAALSALPAAIASVLMVCQFIYVLVVWAVDPLVMHGNINLVLVVAMVVAIFSLFRSFSQKNGSATIEAPT